MRAATRADLPAVAEINAYYVASSVATFEQTPRTMDEWYGALAEITARGLPFVVAEDDSAHGTTTDDTTTDDTARDDTAGSAPLLGYGYCTPWRTRPAYRYTVENSVYVAAGQTGRGVGGAILAALLDRCTAAEIRQVIAVIADSGDPSSVALHRRFGFTEAGRLTGVGFKHGRWVDTVLMQRTLGSPDDPR